MAVEKYDNFSVLLIKNQDCCFLTFDYPYGDTVYGPFKSLEKAKEFGEANASTVDMLPMAIRKED